MTAEIAEIKEASTRAVRANKSLLGDAIRPVKSAEGALRDFVNSRTLPWTDAGLRVLKATGIEQFQYGLIRPLQDFNNAVQAFIDDYDTVKVQARRDLGTAYSDGDFPPRTSLSKRFGADIVYLPMQSASDFRIALTQGEMEMVRSSCQSALDASYREAVHSVVSRLREPIAHMAERLRLYTKHDSGRVNNAFRDTLVENVRGILRLAPDLNITDDPRIQGICDEMHRYLTEHDADALRHSPHLRETVATQAERILAQLDGAFS